MLQAAILGCGVIGPVHAAALRLDRDVRLRWACDVDASTLNRIAADRHTRTLSEVLADPALDLVHVCTPHPTHTDLVLAALAAGKHVLCEKPLASTPGDLARLTTAALAHPHLVVAGVFQHRYAPLARRVRQLMQEGDLGRVQDVEVRFACTRDASYYASAAWRGTRLAEGGGVAINQAIHTLDLALWISRQTPITVHTGRMSRRLACIEVEDFLDATFITADGIPIHFVVDNDGVTNWSQAITIRTDLGWIRLGDGHRLSGIDHPNTAVRQELDALDRAHLDGLPLGGGKAVYGYHHALQVADVLGAIRHRRRPLVTLADAVVANACVLAAYDSAARGGETRLDADPLSYRYPELPLEHP